MAKTRLTADTNKPPTSTFVLGEKIEVTFSVTGLPHDTSTSLLLEVKDALGKNIAEPEPIPLSGDSTGQAAFVFSAPADKLGYYQINARLSDGTPLSGLGSRPSGFISYAVVPDPVTRPDYSNSLSRFGLQGGFSTSAVVMPYLGVRYMLSGYDWAQMEPEFAGQFQQERAHAEQAGKRYPPRAPEYEKPIFNGGEWKTYHLSIITKASLPVWALKADTAGTTCRQFGELNQQGIDALPAFAQSQAKAFASDYKNQSTRYYQVTWEPQTGWCFGGTPAGLVQIFAQSYTAIHQGDLHAIVTGPTLFLDEGSTKQINALFNAGLGKYIDALSFHPYTKWPPEKNGLPATLREQLRAAAKAIGRPVPFIGTEHGFMSNKIGNLNKALGDVRSTIIMLGEGASFDIGFYAADFWDGEDPQQTEGYGFYWNLNPRIKHGTDKLGPKIVVPAYAAMTSFLDGTVSAGPLANTTGTQMGYKFVKYDTTISVIWDYGSSSTYAVPAEAVVCDWMGNCSKSDQSKITIEGTPMYIIEGKLPEANLPVAKASSH
jgi:hypothetical protein